VPAADANAVELSSPSPMSTTSRGSTFKQSLYDPLVTKEPASLSSLSWFYYILVICHMVPNNSIVSFFIPSSPYYARLFGCFVMWIAYATGVFAIGFWPLYSQTSMAWWVLVLGWPAFVLTFALIGFIVIWLFTGTGPAWSIKCCGCCSSERKVEFDSSTPAVSLVTAAQPSPSEVAQSWDGVQAEVIDRETRVMGKMDKGKNFYKDGKFFDAILRQSEHSEVQKFGYHLALASLAISFVGTFVGLLAFQYYSRPYLPAAMTKAWSPIWLVVVWYPAAAIMLMFSLTGFGCLVCTVALLRAHLTRYADWSETQVERVVNEVRSTSVSQKFKSSLDFVIRERYMVTHLVDYTCKCLSRGGFIGGIFAGVVGILLVSSIQSVGWNPLSILVAAAMYTTILALLWTMAALEKGDAAFLDALLDMRGRFPCAYDTDWRDSFAQLRAELDSVIKHCQNTPIGFRFLGFMMTTDLVGGFTYSTLFTIASYLLSAVFGG
jgi:MFS family permease